MFKFKKIASSVLATVLFFSGSIVSFADEGDNKIDFLIPQYAYSNLKDKSFFHEVRPKYRALIESTVFNYNLPTYITKMTFGDKAIPLIVGDDVSGKKDVFSQETLITPLMGDQVDVEYGIYNNIQKKFISKKTTRVNFMEDTEDLPMDSEYPNFSEGESKVARFVDGSNYWLGTVKKENGGYKVTIEVDVKSKHDKNMGMNMNMDYYKGGEKLEPKDIKEDVETDSWFGGKFKASTGKIELVIKNLRDPIEITRKVTNRNNEPWGESELNLRIDPSFDEKSFKEDSILMESKSIRGFPYEDKMIDSGHEYFLENKFNNGPNTISMSFMKESGYNYKDIYKYTIDGTEPTLESKVLKTNGAFKTLEISSDQGEIEELGTELIYGKYPDGGKLKIKIKSFRDGKPNSKTFVHTLTLDKLNVSSLEKEISLNGVKHISRIGVYENLFMKSIERTIYADTSIDIKNINLDEKIIKKINAKNIGRIYPVQISLVDSAGQAAEIPFGWNNEYINQKAEGKPILFTMIETLTENELKPIKIGNGNEISIYEVSESGDIEKVEAEIKVVNKSINIKLPTKKPTSKYIIAEENSYDKELDESKTTAKSEIDKLSKLSNEEKTKYKNRVNNATTKAEVEKILKEAKEANDKTVIEDLDKLKTDTNKEIDKLSKLSNEEKTKYKNRVNSATTKAEVEKILKEAKEANDKEANKAEVYSVPARMLQAHSDTASMGEKALDGNVIVRKKDNKYSYEVTFKGLEFMNMYGHLWGLNIYDSSFTSSKSEARVLKKFMDKNLKGKQMEFPKVYAFDKNSKEDTINIEVYVDAMDAIKNNAQSYDDIVKGAGRQNARLVLDWSKAKKVDDNQGNDSNEVVKRLAGDDRYETAIKISKDNFKSADTVVLASGTNSADALAASSLATSKSAPILLTKRNEIGKNVFDEIKRLNANNVIVVGGKVSISEKVVSDLKNKNITVKRLAGDNRYETSYEIAKELLKSNKAKEAIIVNGFKNVDALSVSSLATKENLPILLNDGNRLSKDIKNIVGDSNIKKMYIIGGRTSLPRRIEDNIKALDIEYERLAGEDRYETSSKIAKYAYENSDKVILASGENSIDALAAGVLTKMEKAPMLLVQKRRIPKSISNRIEESKAKKFLLIGGEKTISDRVKDKVEGLLK